MEILRSRRIALMLVSLALAAFVADGAAYAQDAAPAPANPAVADPTVADPTVADPTAPDPTAPPPEAPKPKPAANPAAANPPANPAAKRAVPPPPADAPPIPAAAQTGPTGNAKRRGAAPAAAAPAGTPGAAAAAPAPTAGTSTAATAEGEGATAAAAPPAPPPQPLPQFGPQNAAAGAARFGIILPAEKFSELQTHWQLRRDYLRDRDERRAEDEENRIRDLRDDFGIDNLFAIGSALVRESQEALAAGAPGLAKKRCLLAVELAPALAEAHTCKARAIFAEDFTAVGSSIAALRDAVRYSWTDPRVQRSVFTNTATVFLFGILIAGVAFVALLFARYAKLYLHDFHHIFPKGARPWQTRLLSVALVLSPIFLQLGPVPLLFTALAATAIYVSTLEMAVGLAVLVTVAAAPFGAEGIARLAAYGGAAADVWLIEHGVGTTAALQRLNRRLEAQSEFPVAFSLARRAKREGDLAQAEALYKKATESTGLSTEALAAARNNLGNVYLLSGDSARAMAQYQQAADLQDGMAAVHFNMSRALGLGGVEQLEKVQAEQARAKELDRAAIDAFTGNSLVVNRKANRFLIDVSLPDATLDPLNANESLLAEPVGDEARALLGGPLPAGFAPIFPLVAGMAFVALHFLRGRIKPSGRCERCGREVCKRCDEDARPSEALCAQCVNVFVRRNNVDPTERFKKEQAVKQYQERRTLMLRLAGLVSGAGHVLIGYPLRGALFLLLGGCALGSILFWAGVARDPTAVRAGMSFVRLGIILGSCVLIYGLCLRDLFVRQRSENN
ncbi:MAG: tetratricopeptide repeat protein [Deltaproteobacteria bacterium]|nr:tetratricopeptide repeat protein [Deltaproteobacteria bacterium]